MTFRVGQKVVCIEGCNESGFLLIEGAIYTISGHGYFGSKFLYDLAEVSTSAPHAWRGTRFRPVISRKTDISIFRALLVPSKQGADA
jgi:hypothetical protein